MGEWQAVPLHQVGGVGPEQHSLKGVASSPSTFWDWAGLLAATVEQLEGMHIGLYWRGEYCCAGHEQLVVLFIHLPTN